MPFPPTHRVRAILFALAAFILPGIRAQNAPAPQNPPPSYLGFDANNYPGDDALAALRRTFSFAGYWLSNPPGANSNPWLGKRPALLRADFGFLVLSNGRPERELKSIAHAAMLGSSDAEIAVDAAIAEGFQRGTIIFLDQEEGGRMQPDQMAYIFAWIDGVASLGFRTGIYCSGMPASEGRGQFVVTANDILNYLAGREVTFFIYNDACPPSPGCAYGHAPQPADSGITFASIWQFAQSPRRKEFTNSCAATYDRERSCNAPAVPGDARPESAFPIDLDSASSPDPSGGKRQGRRRRTAAPQNVAANQRRKLTG